MTYKDLNSEKYHIFLLLSSKFQKCRFSREFRWHLCIYLVLSMIRHYSLYFITIIFLGWWCIDVFIIGGSRFYWSRFPIYILFKQNNLPYNGAFDFYLALGQKIIYIFNKWTHLELESECVSGQNTVLEIEPIFRCMSINKKSGQIS